jgi:hypothetical protein
MNLDRYQKNTNNDIYYTQLKFYFYFSNTFHSFSREEIFDSSQIQKHIFFKYHFKRRMLKKTYVRMIHWRVERLAFRSNICINRSIPNGLISSIFTTHSNLVTMRSMKKRLGLRGF